MPETITSSRAQVLTAGQLATRSGVNVETIRYFEKIGMLPLAGRTANGHRRFDDTHLRQLVFIRRARAMGFSQDDVRSLLALSDDSSKSCADIKLIADANLRGIRTKIAGLKRLEQILADASSHCGRGELPQCPVIDALRFD